MMNQNDLTREENEIQMEVENPEEYADPAPLQLEEVHPLALVAINVENVVAAAPSATHFELVENALEIEARAPTPESGSSRASTPVALLNYEEESSQSEGRSRKRSHDDDAEDDGSVCPICLDNWATSGGHRICALKCGHLFGYACVKRWLDTQRKKTCPTCKKKVGKDDIRYIYAKKLTAVDTTELDNVRKQLEFVTEERNKAHADLAKYVCREYLLTQEIAQLKSQLKTSKTASAPSANVQQVVRMYMEKAVEVCKFGGSRVFDAKCELDLLMASMKSPSNLFMGFGLKKMNISGYRTTAFIPVHTLQIRDICFHPENSLVLTASMDKTFKVVDSNTNATPYQFVHQMPLWSCCWDANNSFILYVGTQSGSVIKYDIRNLTEPICTLSIEGDMSPVVSVASIPSFPGEALAQGGVVSCKLNSLWVYENASNQHVRHSLSLDGPFVSMKYQPNLKQLLVSSRPNNRITYSRHTLCTLEKNDQDKVDCNIIHSFQGGGMQKLLSKSCFLSHSNEYVAAHQENCRSVFLWSINTGEKVCSVPAHDTVLDLKGLQNQNGDFLVSLTEKKLEFFKFT